MFAKFDEIPSLPVQDIKKNQNVSVGQCDNGIPPGKLGRGKWGCIIKV